MKTVVEMAREAGMAVIDDQYSLLPFLERLVELARADEREACAKVCDEKVDAEYATGKVDHNEMGWTQACANAIRARGNT